MNNFIFDDGWWIRSSASNFFSNKLLKYFVQLYISYIVDNKIYRNPCTGILLEVKGKLLWISAGHVVESIINYYKNGMINDLRWIDRWDVKGVDTLPFSKRNIEYYLGNTHGTDYGAILLSILEAENFKSNRNLKPLVMTIGITDSPIKTPEGYILAGFPWDMANIDLKPMTNNKDKVSLSSKLICLPLEKITWKDISSHEKNWKDKEAFYAQILEYSDKEESQPDELKGMSGGPVFSFYRDQNFLNIKLEAIFDSYHKKTHQIRAEPIDRILINLESWVNELMERVK